jgi:hypothetical protein
MRTLGDSMIFAARRVADVSSSQGAQRRSRRAARFWRLYSSARPMIEGEGHHVRGVGPLCVWGLFTPGG